MMNRRIAVCFGLFFSAVSAAAAQTASSEPQVQNLSLEQLLETKIPTVVGASKFAQEVVDAPASVTIVTREEIERFSYRSLADVLRGVRGFYVTYDRNYAYLGVRGFSRPGDFNTRVLLLVDGHRLNDNVYDMAYIGTDFPVDLDLIDRVEIVRGPSSSLYGTSAFFAVVNVITRRGSAVNAEASASAGSQGTGHARTSYGRSHTNGIEWLVSGAAYSSDGLSPVSIDGVGSSLDGMDRDRFWNAFGALTRGNWGVQGAYIDREKGIPTGAYETVLTDRRSKTVDARGYLDVQYQGPVRGTSVLWRAYYDRYNYDGVYAYGDDTGTLIDRARGQWWGTETTLTRRVGSHLVTSGGEFRFNLRQLQGSYYDDDPEAETIIDPGTSSLWAVFAQDEFKLSRTFTLSAGLRYDHWPTFGGTTNPRVALIFKPQAAASLKLLYGRAFRAPNSYELFYYGDASDHLQPERINSTEVSWEQYLAGHVRVGVQGFHSRINNLITQVPSADQRDGLGFANIGTTEASGFEWEIEKTWPVGVQTLGAYTYVRALTGDDEVLSNSPRHLGRARVLAPLFGNRLSVGMEMFYTSSRVTLSGESTSGFALGNLTLTSGELFRRVRLSLDVDNVFNRSYSDPGGEEHLAPSIPQDGRTARAKLTWRF